jgi:rhodanese-related sulfurtransferase
MELNSQKCQELLQTSEDLSVIDLRSSTEYAQSRIPGANNIDVLSPNAFERIAKLKRDNPYLVYCESGIRSKSAIKIMTDMGFSSLYFLVNGLSRYNGPLDNSFKNVAD